MYALPPADKPAETLLMQGELNIKVATNHYRSGAHLQGTARWAASHETLREARAAFVGTSEAECEHFTERLLREETRVCANLAQGLLARADAASQGEEATCPPAVLLNRAIGFADLALVNEPTHEKALVRRVRALSQLGDAGAAQLAAEQAVANVPALANNEIIASARRARVPPGANGNEAQPVAVLWRLTVSAAADGRGEDLLSAREGHTLSLVGPELILIGGIATQALPVVGGGEGVCEPFSCELDELEASGGARWRRMEWSSMADAPPLAIRHHTATEIDGRLFLYGGETPGERAAAPPSPARDAIRIDLVAGVRVWTPDTTRGGPGCWERPTVVGPEPEERTMHAAAGARGRLWVHGGVGNGGAVLGDTWGFDPATRAWTRCAGMPAENTPPSRCLHGMCADGDRLFLFGGAGFHPPSVPEAERESAPLLRDNWEIVISARKPKWRFLADVCWSAGDRLSSSPGVLTNGLAQPACFVAPLTLSLVSEDSGEICKTGSEVKCLVVCGGADFDTACGGVHIMPVETPPHVVFPQQYMWVRVQLSERSIGEPLVGAPLGRRGVAAVPLPDGRVVLCGGTPSARRALEMTILDLEQPTFGETIGPSESAAGSPSKASKPLGDGVPSPQSVEDLRGTIRSEGLNCVGGGGERASEMPLLSVKSWAPSSPDGVHEILEKALLHQHALTTVRAVALGGSGWGGGRFMPDEHLLLAAFEASPLLEFLDDRRVLAGDRWHDTSQALTVLAGAMVSHAIDLKMCGANAQSHEWFRRVLSFTTQPWVRALPRGRGHGLGQIFGHQAMEVGQSWHGALCPPQAFMRRKGYARKCFHIIDEPLVEASAPVAAELALLAHVTDDPKGAKLAALCARLRLDASGLASAAARDESVADAVRECVFDEAWYNHVTFAPTLAGESVLAQRMREANQAPAFFYSTFGWRPRVCAGCGREEQQPETWKACKGCRAVAYCGRHCQVSAWKAAHKPECASLAAAVADGSRTPATTTAQLAKPVARTHPKAPTVSPLRRLVADIIYGSARAADESLEAFVRAAPQQRGREQCSWFAQLVTKRGLSAFTPLERAQRAGMPALAERMEAAARHAGALAQ